MQQIQPFDIPRLLSNNKLPPVILLFGDEPQQKLDIIDAIRKKAKEDGFEERQSFTLDGDFNWNQLNDALQSMSLFSELKYIELTMLSSKPGTTGSKQFIEISQMLNEEVVLLIHGPKAGKDVQKSKWFTALAKDAWFCHVYDLQGNQLQKWLQSRARELQLNISPNGLSMISDMCEGNLMAGRQELEKISLLFPDKTIIEHSDIEQMMVQQSRYSSFQFTDELLKGDMQRAIKILSQLENEGIEPVVILWSMVNEAQTLTRLKDSEATSGRADFRAARIWQSKQGLYQSALSRLDKTHLDHLNQQLSKTDVAIKSVQLAKPYVRLAHLGLLFAGQNIPVTHISAYDF